MSAERQALGPLVLIFQWPFKRDKSTINLLNIWLLLFIFSGYLIHVIDDVVFSSAKTHLPTDNLIVAVRLPRTFLKLSRATGRPISESLLVLSTVFDAAISRLMTSVHSKLSQSRQYALLKTTSQRHCISNVRHDPGYSLDAVMT
jgi:hypothetical protein